MIHLSRKRFFMAGAIFAIIGLCAWFHDRGLASSRDGTFSGKSAAAAALSGSGTPPRDLPAARPSRDSRDRKNAEAKLRSLLEVRDGEMAFLRIPQAMMPDLAEKVQDLVSDQPAVPALSKVKDRQRFVEELQTRMGPADTVEGAINAADGPFAWHNGEWQISGQALPNSEREVTLQISIRVGEGELVSTISLQRGDMIVLHLKEPQPEALLIVIGEKKESSEGVVIPPPGER